MRTLFPFFLLLLSMSFQTPQKKKKIIFFGDSITELGIKPNGYIRELDSISGGKHDLIGSGISGNKVYDLYLRHEADVLEKSPDIVVIFIGVNDIWHKRLTGTGTDPDKFENFYQALITKLQQKKIELVLSTPAVIGEKTDRTNGQDEDLERYSSIVRKLAKNNNIGLVDLRTAFVSYNRQHNRENLQSGMLTYDGVHLNDKGNQLVAEKMWEVLGGM
jgi:isoamyl acetate esterase